jgi:sec-independent protein translocase protein TatA
VLVFFGSKKIPELAQGIGKGIREFKKATSDTQDDENEAKKIEQKPADEKKG